MTPGEVFWLVIALLLLGLSGTMDRDQGGGGRG